MKKLFALLLALMMVFTLAACGNNETPSGSEGDNPGTSQPDNQGGSENQGGEENKGGKELYDVTDAQITVAPVRSMALMTCRASFFAPCGLIVPLSLWPPSITNELMMFLPILHLYM